MKKKVLIISKEFDESTGEVMNWIDYYGGETIRSNGEDFMSHNGIEYSMQIDNEVTNINLSKGTDFWYEDQIYSVWFRQNGNPRIQKEILKSVSHKSISQYAFRELKTFQESLNNRLSGKRKLGNFEKNRINKIYALNKAKGEGLHIPPTLITTSKVELVDFFEKHGPLISKAIGDAPSLVFDMDLYMMYTCKVDSDMIQSLPDTFFISLFQKQIEKEIELRVFYLDGQIYSMGIFSQLDDQTSVDFRRYNYQTPNRNIPYELPEDIEEKIRRFMHAVDLNTGSIDLILDKSGLYYFLEVNPVGQFGMTSRPCNYYIEEKIAKYLLNENG